MKLLRMAALAWLGIASVPMMTSLANAGAKPNFVIILVDDMGYGDIGCYGSALNQTPNCDRMAAQGMKLTSFYTAPVCTPSRASLLTGCYAKRVSLPEVIRPAAKIGLSEKEHTIADLLKQQGYATECIGKWHVGDQVQFLPTHRGFDHYLGFPYSNDMGGEWDGSPETPPGKRFPPMPLVRDDTVIDTMNGDKQDRIEEIYTDEAVKFIGDHKDGPFFLYLAHTAVHVPLHPGAAFKGKSKNGKYGDWIEEMDASTGRVLDALRDLKLADNTLVVFTSDNGPWLVEGKNGGVATPLRGGKGGTYEGGMREPTIAWWPGHIAPGTSSDAVTGEIDLLPTFVKLAGGIIASDNKIDGADIMPLLDGRTRESPRGVQYYFDGDTLQAVRSGPWKMAIGPQREQNRLEGQPQPVSKPPFPKLYNLETDIGETTDVAADHPDVVKQLQQYVETMDADLGISEKGPGVRSPGRVENPVPLLLKKLAAPGISSIASEADDPGPAIPPTAIYKNASQPVDARVADLLSRMTLEEKVQQMSQFHQQHLPLDQAGLEKAFGSIAPGILVVNFSASADANAVMFRTAQQYLRNKTRLGIPAITCCEALHGLMLQPATIYPQAIGLGATWDPPLVKEIGAQVAQEASAVGICQVLSPVLDLGREPRYGRVEETYGECPTLVSRMGVAFITGYQGDDAQTGLSRDHVYCMTKHFAGYSVPANGINIAPSLIGEREMLTLHLIPFEAAVKEAHVMAVMPGYNSVDGLPSHANHWLLTDILRSTWGFPGYVYSDWDGINFLIGHRVALNKQEAGVKALKAGVDLEAPQLDCFSAFPGMVKDKQLDVALVDQAVSRILRAKFIAGLFDEKRTDGDPELVAQVVHTPGHIATSRKLADEGIILLKNQGNLLPLDAAKLKSIAVIGPNADQVQFGDYSWSKSNKHGINFLQAMKSHYAGKIAINYSKGCDLVGLSNAGFADAVKAAGNSDVAVVVIGDTSMIFSGVGWDDPTVPANGTVGEGFDVTNPVPPGVQEDLVKAVVAAGKPTIVILLNGRPYCLPWMHDNVPAIVEAFYPGEQQGNSLVDILFGKVNPSGRLPVTLAKSVGQLPCTYDFKGYGRGYYHQPGSPAKPGRDYVFDSPAPLWPFGFGLSYTTFAFSDLKIATPSVSTGDGMLKFSYTVKNTGAVAGKVVPQAYWRQLDGEIAPPEKRLLRFEKLELEPGESKTLAYEIPTGEFRSLTVDNKWVVAPGPIEIQVGDNAESISGKQRFTFNP